MNRKSKKIVATVLSLTILSTTFPADCSWGINEIFSNINSDVVSAEEPEPEPEPEQVPDTDPTPEPENELVTITESISFDSTSEFEFNGTLSLTKNDPEEFTAPELDTGTDHTYTITNKGDLVCFSVKNGTNTTITTNSESVTSVTIENDNTTYYFFKANAAETYTVTATANDNTPTITFYDVVASAVVTGINEDITDISDYVVPETVDGTIGSGENTIPQTFTVNSIDSSFSSDNKIIFIPSSVDGIDSINGSGMAIQYTVTDGTATVTDIKFSAETSKTYLTIPSSFTSNNTKTTITGFAENILTQESLTVLFEAENNDNSIAESLITAGADVVCLYSLTDEETISFNHVAYSDDSYENNDEFRKNYKFESTYNVFGTEYNLAKLPENIGSVQNHTHNFSKEDNANNTETCTICGLEYSNGFTTTGVYDPDKEYYGYVITEEVTDETTGETSSKEVVKALFDKPEKVNNVYQISNAGELYWFAAHVNAQIKDKYGDDVKYDAVLTSDIDLSVSIPEGLQWTPIYNKMTSSSGTGYAGDFNGNGHIISGLNISGTGELVGLFGRTNNATIENVAIVDSEIIIDSGTVKYCGSFVAYAINTVLENVYTHSGIKVEDNVQLPKNYYYGGLCGYASAASITNAYSYFVNEQSDHISPISAIEVTCDNVYYINSVKREPGSDGKDIDTEYADTEGIYGTAKTAEEFESGHVAWLLQNKDICEKTGVKFSQKLAGNDVDATPVLATDEAINLVYDYDEYTTCYVSENPENKSTKYTNDPDALNKYDFSKNYSADTAETIKPNIYSCIGEHNHEIKDEDGNVTGISLICLNKDEGKYTGKCTHLLDTSSDDADETISYDISTKEELKAVMDMLNGEKSQDLNGDGIINKAPDNTSNIIINLNKDIDVSNTDSWVPIKKFEGTFNGNKHVISNLNISSDSQYVGFFEELTGSVSWLGLEGCKFESSYSGDDAYIGGIAGKFSPTSDENSTSTVSISNCYTANLDLDIDNDVVKGGIVGYNEGLIKNCHSYNLNIAISGKNPEGEENPEGEGSTTTYVENCYYLSSDTDTVTDNGNGTPTTAATFESGKVTFSLASDENAGWGQNLEEYTIEEEGKEPITISADLYPVFINEDETSEQPEEHSTVVHEYYEHGEDTVGYTNDTTDKHTKSDADSSHDDDYTVIPVFSDSESEEDTLKDYRPNADGHFEQCSTCKKIIGKDGADPIEENRIPHEFTEWEINQENGSHDADCSCGYHNSHPMDKNGQYISTADYHFPLFGCGEEDCDLKDNSFLNFTTSTWGDDFEKYRHSFSESYVYKDENTHLATCNICKATVEDEHEEDGSCCGISYGGFIESFNPDIVSEERVAFKFHYVPEGDYKLVSYGVFYSNDGTPLSEDFEQNKNAVNGETIKSHTKVVTSDITSQMFTAKILDKGKSIYAMAYMTLTNSEGNEIVVSGNLVVFDNNIEDMDRVQEDIKVSISDIKSIYKSSSSNPYRIDFPVTREIPDEYTLVNYGIMYSNNGTEITNNTTLDDVDKTNIKTSSKSDYKNGTYTASIGADFEIAVYVRGYVTVKDKYGNTHTVYSDVASRKYGVDIGFSSIESVYDTKARIAFSFTREISADFEMVKYGVIYSNNGTEITNADTLATVDGTNIKSSTKTDYKNGTYTANISVSGDNAVYARGYITLKDKNGNEFTVYTDAETATYTG